MHMEEAAFLQKSFVDFSSMNSCTDGGSWELFVVLPLKRSRLLIAYELRRPICYRRNDLPLYLSVKHVSFIRILAPEYHGELGYLRVLQPRVAIVRQLLDALFHIRK